MPSLFDIGIATSLEDLSAELMRRIAARGLDHGPAFPRLAERILADHPDCRALVIPAGTAIDGDLDLDEGLLESKFTVLAVLGDLRVGGRILNADGEAGPYLFVDGNVEARQIIKGGSSFVFLGSAAARDVVFCDYNNGAFMVGGDISAPALITNNQIIKAGGQIIGPIIGDEHANMRDKLVPDVFEDPEDPADEWPVGELIRERLAAGLPVLKAA